MKIIMELGAIIGSVALLAGCGGVSAGRHFCEPDGITAGFESKAPKRDSRHKVNSEVIDGGTRTITPRADDIVVGRTMDRNHKVYETWYYDRKVPDILIKVAGTGGRIYVLDTGNKKLSLNNIAPIRKCTMPPSPSVANGGQFQMFREPICGNEPSPQFAGSLSKTVSAMLADAKGVCGGDLPPTGAGQFRLWSVSDLSVYLFKPDFGIGSQLDEVDTTARRVRGDEYMTDPAWAKVLAKHMLGVVVAGPPATALPAKSKLRRRLEQEAYELNQPVRPLTLDEWIADSGDRYRQGIPELTIQVADPVAALKALEEPTRKAALDAELTAYYIGPFLRWIGK